VIQLTIMRQGKKQNLTVTLQPGN